MADEKPGDTPEPAEIDIDAIDDLPQEDFDKLKRGEIEPPKKGAKAPEKTDGTRDEFDVDPKSETVPHGQFHRVNERRKAAEAETAKERTAREQAETRANTVTQRLAELIEASKPAPVQQEAQADPDVFPGEDWDLEGKINWLTTRENQRIERERQAATQRGQQTEAQRIIGAKVDEYQAVKAQFPAIEEARQTVLKGWHRELWMQGYRGQELEQRVSNTEAQWVLYAHQKQMPVANMIAELAMARGWKPPDDDAPANPTGEVAATGADAAATPQRDASGKFVAASAAMDKREATKAAAKSLGGSGGPADTGELTPQMIADMSNEDFAAFKKKFGDKAMAKAFGVAR